MVKMCVKKKELGPVGWPTPEIFVCRSANVFNFLKGSCSGFNPSSYQSFLKHLTCSDAHWQITYTRRELGCTCLTTQGSLLFLRGHITTLLRLSTRFTLLRNIKGILGFKIQQLADTSASFVVILGNEVLQHEVVFAQLRYAQINQSVGLRILKESVGLDSNPSSFFQILVQFFSQSKQVSLPPVSVVMIPLFPVILVSFPGYTCFMLRRTKLLVHLYYLSLKMDHPGVILVMSDLDGPLDQDGPFS